MCRDGRVRPTMRIVSERFTCSLLAHYRHTSQTLIRYTSLLVGLYILLVPSYAYFQGDYSNKVDALEPELYVQDEYVENLKLWIDKLVEAESGGDPDIVPRAIFQPSCQFVLETSV